MPQPAHWLKEEERNMEQGQIKAPFRAARPSPTRIRELPPDLQIPEQIKCLCGV